MPKCRSEKGNRRQNVDILNEVTFLLPFLLPFGDRHFGIDYLFSLASITFSVRGDWAPGGGTPFSVRGDWAPGGGPSCNPAWGDLLQVPVQVRLRDDLAPGRGAK
jgi:hypothetical protein